MGTSNASQISVPCVMDWCSSRMITVLCGMHPRTERPPGIYLVSTVDSIRLYNRLTIILYFSGFRTN